MIALLKGRLNHKSSESVIVDVGGVGYELFIPLSTFLKLPEPGELIELKVHMVVRDDSIRLFGFLTAEEKSIFLMLTSVSGVGPKLARNILSGISVDDLIAAVSGENVARLVAVPGLGKKTAERLIVELKDKVRQLLREGAFSEGDSQVQVATGDDDVVSALVNLGYKEQRAIEAAKSARSDLGESASIEEMIKVSLNIIASK